MNGDLKIHQMIELALLATDCVISVLEEPDSHFLEERRQLALLLEQVRSGKLHAERAEVIFQAIQDRGDEWLRDNPIPPD